MEAAERKNLGLTRLKGQSGFTLLFAVIELAERNTLMRAVGKQLANERGIVLVIALLIIALLLVSGIGAMISMRTDLKSSGNLRASTQAFYFADAGIIELRINNGTL